MWIFIIINIIKLIIWTIIIYLSYNYIDLSKDFVVWILSMWTWIFITFWAISFFIMLWILKLISKNKNNYLALTSYKYTWLLAFYLISNFFLISFKFWSMWIWIVMLLIFIIMWIIL